MTMPVVQPLKQESALSSSRAPGGVRAVLLDSLGTLVELEPPWVHLGAELGTDADDRLVRAVRAEMAYYKAHSHTGRDARSRSFGRGAPRFSPGSWGARSMSRR